MIGLDPVAVVAEASSGGQRLYLTAVVPSGCDQTTTFDRRLKASALFHTLAL